ncbi:MAG: ABC transporter ATP-binding protein [Propionibacteriaceae bacterium]|nr:ABC transporter ATP-binding protein [Propionibacteriaceae bacterium]
MSDEPLVIVKDMCAAYGKTEVLHNIDMELPPGRITGLVGPSGHGKTTLVSVIVGALRAKSGTVTVLGESAPPRRVKSSIGFMPQAEALYADLTGDENLRFFGALYGMTAAQMAERIPVVLKQVSLPQQGGKVVAEYSGGMQRRLSLAVALLHEPRLLVLDEPTVGLDPAHRVALWATFRQLADGGATFLVTTHVMDEAANCDTVLLIHDGRVLAAGSPDELVSVSGTANLEGAFLQFEASQNHTEEDGNA